MARKTVAIEQAKTELDISVAFAVDTVWMTTGRDSAKAFLDFSTCGCCRTAAWIYRNNSSILAATSKDVLKAD